MRRYLLLIPALLIHACTEAQPVPAVADKHGGETVNFLAVGDAGLHLDWYDPDDLGFSRDEFIAKEREDWLEDLKPIEEFSYPPLYEYPDTGFAVEQPGQFATSAAMENYCRDQDCEFMIVLGDNIYPDGADGSGSPEDQQRLMDILVTPYHNLEPARDNFRMYAALGNHDWKSSRAGRDAQVAFGASGDTRYVLQEPGFYSFRRGNAEFWVIDTMMLLADSVVYEDRLDAQGREVLHSELDDAPAWAKPQSSVERNQLNWLASTMAASDAEWKIVYGHHSLWSAGGTKYAQAHVLRPLLLPILCRHADLWFNGHEHDLGIFSDSCESVLGHTDRPLPLIVSGAGAKQRAINPRFHQYQEATYPAYEGHWMQGMTWGFAHVSLGQKNGIVTMVTTPNDQSGTPEVAFEFQFPRRSGAISSP